MKNILLTLEQKRTPADLFVIGFFEKEKLHKSAGILEPDFAKILKPAMERGRFDGKFGQVFSSAFADGEIGRASCRERVYVLV